MPSIRSRSTRQINRESNYPLESGMWINTAALRIDGKPNLAEGRARSEKTSQKMQRPKGKLRVQGRGGERVGILRRRNGMFRDQNQERE